MASSSATVIAAALGAPPTQLLTRKNVLVWKALVIPALRGACVLDLVEGRDKAPVETLDVEDADKQKTTVINPAYATWIARDQQVLRWLVNALSPDVLAHVVGLESSAETWTAINAHVSASSKSRVQHLRTALVETKKVWLAVEEVLRLVDRTGIARIAGVMTVIARIAGVMIVRVVVMMMGVDGVEVVTVVATKDVVMVEATKTDAVMIMVGAVEIVSPRAMWTQPVRSVTSMVTPLKTVGGVMVMIVVMIDVTMVPEATGQNLVPNRAENVAQNDVQSSAENDESGTTFDEDTEEHSSANTDPRADPHAGGSGASPAASRSPPARGRHARPASAASPSGSRSPSPHAAPRGHTPSSPPQSPPVSPDGSAAPSLSAAGGDPTGSSAASSGEPSTLHEALDDSNWRNAMEEEYNALMKNKTLHLVPPNKNRNLIDCKWVYRIKKRADGSIDRYKARLVAKGFKQRYGIDYVDTFSPVVKISTIRTVSIAMSRGWSLRQLDVKNVFLHGVLEEEVYMKQPPGFKDPHVPHHVCRLDKALYGLKQAPRAWYSRLSSKLCALGFTPSKADTSLFLFQKSSITIFVLVYVDDIIVTSSSSNAISALLRDLNVNFAIKDLGDLHFFLGIEVKRVNNVLLLTEEKYALELLAKVGMSQFNKICQYLHAPTTDYWTTAKRILRYVKETTKLGITFKPSSSTLLSGFFDADWAGDVDDKRSTGGFAIFVGPNLVSWSARKQATVSRSSTEAEYKALANAPAEMIWVEALLVELGVKL
ncbi:hypothetical protein QYE76_062624 [Lolium multiflorum]|uniref:Reverse transcriptase Ty1/copia-type domain-containing protein n=1 Tax=Lolium multiflorum TaxID=4521 RepID=A0AAD8S3D9_LOLMU|nr:hypothetical protein QYE76_062624 [Lolium multiflorum]